VEPPTLLILVALVFIGESVSWRVGGLVVVFLSSLLGVFFLFIFVSHFFSINICTAIILPVAFKKERQIGKDRRKKIEREREKERVRKQRKREKTSQLKKRH
jgi:hypothetical protein